MIAHLLPSLSIGGVERSVVELATWLQARTSESGLSNRVITWNAGGPLEASLVSAGVEVTVLSGPDVLPKLINELQAVDIAHVHTFEESLLPNIAARYAGVPAVFETIHAPYTRWSGSRADVVCAVSKAVAVLQPCEPDVQIVPVACEVPEPTVERAVPTQTIRLVEIRRAGKDMYAPLSVLHSYLDVPGFDIESTIVGVEGTDRPGLRFVGEVEDITPYLDEADFLVHFPSFEAFGRVLCEAMAAGVVPVTHHAGGIPEAVGEGGALLYPEGLSLDRLAEEVSGDLTDLLREPHYIEGLRETGREHVRSHFSAAATWGKQAELYRIASRSVEGRRAQTWADGLTSSQTAVFLRAVEASQVLGNDSDLLLSGATSASHSLPDWHRAELLGLHGVRAAREERNALALLALGHAVEAQRPLRPEWVMELASALDKGDQKEAAQELMVLGSKLFPHYLPFWVHAITLMVELEQADTAGALLDQMRSVYPDHPTVSDLRRKLLLLDVSQRERKARGMEKPLKIDLSGLSMDLGPPSSQPVPPLSLSSLQPKPGDVPTASGGLDLSGLVAAPSSSGSPASISTGLDLSGLRVNVPTAVSVVAPPSSPAPPKAVPASPRVEDRTRSGVSYSNRAEGPFFIAGCPRSGINLLRLVLDAHPSLSVGPATGLLMASDPEEKLAVYGFDQADWAEISSEGRNPFVLCKRWMARHADRQGKPRWGEASPGHLPLLSNILAGFPGSCFIHVVRDPRDVVCSLKTHPRNVWRDGGAVPTGITRAVEDPGVLDLWVEQVSKGLEGARGFEDRVLLLRYESLVEDQERVLRGVLNFLGAEWSDAVLSHHTLEKAGSRHPRHSVNSPGTSRALHGDQVGRWKTELTREEGALIWSRAGDLMRLFGYAQDDAWLTTLRA